MNNNHPDKSQTHQPRPTNYGKFLKQSETEVSKLWNNLHIEYGLPSVDRLKGSLHLCGKGKCDEYATLNAAYRTLPDGQCNPILRSENCHHTN